jgi:hypothetical protein
MANKVNMRVWVAALRSGEFKQGKGRLVRKDPDTGVWKHCCMGVACVLADRANVEMEVLVSAECKSFDGSTTLLPKPVYNWLGLDGDNDREDPRVHVPNVPGNGEPDLFTLSVINDDFGFTFHQIADLIEADYGLLGADDDGQ